MNFRGRAANWLTSLIVCAAWLGAAVLFELAQTYSYRPHTVLGWLLFVVAIPVAWVLSEAFGALLDREPAGQWVDRRTANKRFSWARVLYLLLRTLLVLVVITAAVWFAVSYAPAVQDLFRRHFGPDVREVAVATNGTDVVPTANSFRNELRIRLLRLPASTRKSRSPRARRDLAGALAKAGSPKRRRAARVT